LRALKDEKLSIKQPRGGGGGVEEKKEHSKTD